MKKRGFTLIELVAVLVIMAIIALIATPLVLSLINNAKASANKRSVDAYGKAVEIAVSNYLTNKGGFPKSIEVLDIEYTGKEVSCKMMQLNKDGCIYLSRCSVDGVDVKDAKVPSGWYSYGKQSEEESGIVADGPAVSSLIAKANDISMTTYEEDSDLVHEMYTFAHEKTVQTGALNDYRYIGNNPYNYVTFNDEIWRIIGVFSTEDENGKVARRIKIIKDETIKKYPWDYSNYNAEGEYYEGGKDDWINSKINSYLNGEYYESLSSEAKTMVSPVKYYLGEEVTEVFGFGGGAVESAVASYEWERGNMINPSDKASFWLGNVGLMYPSDYLYTYANGVDGVCFDHSSSCGWSYWDEETETDIESDASKGWLFIPGDEENYFEQWTITSDYEATTGVIIISSDGNAPSGSIDGEAMIRPVLYLDSNVKITEGNGSKDKPYKLAI